MDVLLREVLGRLERFMYASPIENGEKHDASSQELLLNHEISGSCINGNETRNMSDQKRSRSRFIREESGI
jgi:hypothetical protein